MQKISGGERSFVAPKTLQEVASFSFVFREFGCKYKHSVI